MSAAALVLTLVRALPASPALLLARLLVVLWLGFNPRARAEIRRNYRLLFGHDQPGFWLRNAWQVGRNLVLMGRMDLRPARFLIDKAEVSGDNTYKQSTEQNMHAIMASFHFGLWEYLPRIFRRQGHRVALALGVQRDRVLDRMLLLLRSRDGVRLLRNAAALGRGGSPGLTGFMLDNTRRGKLTTARFGPVRLQMPGLAFRLAGRAQPAGGAGIHTGPGVMPLFCTLERGRLRVRVYPAGGPDHALECLLKEIHRRPTDWIFWGKAGALEAA